VPLAGNLPDARLVKAEDSDTSAFCKALARKSAGPVKNAVTPQRLGVGISAGVDLFVHGLKMDFEEATRNQQPRVIIGVDIKNAHNDFPRDIAMQIIIAAAQAGPRLIPFAVIFSYTLMANPIFMRSKKNNSGFDRICDSLKGGGQGNALMGQIFVLVQYDTLKEAESRFPVTLKAIHDDIAL
jgi:hypothetical protein